MSSLQGVLARIVATALVSSTLVVVPIFSSIPAVASTPSVSGPENSTAAPGTNHDPGDFAITGFNAGDSLLVSIGFLNAPSNTSFSIATTSGLTPAAGYSATTWQNLERISFIANQADTNDALASLTVVAGNTIGNFQVRVSATLNEDGVVYNPLNNHFYRYFDYADLNTPLADRTWTKANETATNPANSVKGRTGYLATVTSADEADFLGNNVTTDEKIWVGGLQSLEAGKSAGSQVGSDYEWKWVGGPEAGTVFWESANSGENTYQVAGQYENWCRNTTTPFARKEPNGLTEEALVIRWGGGNDASCWNDWAGTNTTGSGFIVEYDAEGAEYTGVYSATATITVNYPITGQSAEAGNAQATVSWTAPTSGTVTGYQVTSSPGGHTCTTTLTSCTVVGLTNGTPYTFEIVASFDGTQSTSVASTTAVTPVDSAPGASGPSIASGLVNEAITLGDFSISDPFNCGWGTMTATVTVGSGSLNATASGSATVTGSNSSTMTVTGSRADVADTLDSVTLTGSTSGSYSVSTEIVPSVDFQAPDGNRYHLNDGNGHYYRVLSPAEIAVADGANHRTKAINLARTLSFCGFAGYLVAVDDATEQSFIETSGAFDAISPKISLYTSGDKTQGYVAGPNPNFTGTWRWYPGNGAPAGYPTNFYDQGTRNGGTPPWQSNQPDGSGVYHAFWYTGGKYGWDDLGDANATGYGALVEFGATTSFSVPTVTTTVSVRSVPAAPGSFEATAGTTDGQLDLTWTAPSDGGSAITGYTVEYRTAGTGSFQPISDLDGSSTDTQATVGGLDTCVAYDFRVFATNANGDGVSSTITATAFGATGLTPYQASQFILGGDATASATAVTLTADERNLAGALWSGTRLDLSQSFCIRAEIKLSDTVRSANSSSGADGVAFVLQPSDTTSLSSGGGLGYSPDIAPAFAVEFDTYFNNGIDVAQQEIALRKEVGGSNAAWGPNAVDVTSNNIEDGQFHLTEIRFDAGQKVLSVLFDFNSDGDFDDAGEIVFQNVDADLDAFFADTSLVYWGFTAATGGETNLQQVRAIEYLPASLAVNTSPSATNPGAQSVAVGSSTTVSVALDDSGETSQSQWRLSVTAGNSSAVTASVTAASATEATISLTGVANADTTITLTAVDADGASTSVSFDLRVGSGTPAAQNRQNNSTRQNLPPTVPLATPTGPAQQSRLPLPPAPTPNPQVFTAPPQTPNSPSVVPDQTRALVGGVPSPLTTTRNGDSQVNVQTGSVQLGVQTRGGGSVQDNPQTNQPELRVPHGGSTSFSGTGLLPGSSLQVWLPGLTSREIGRLPVNADGTFQGEVTLSQPQGQPALPIGRQVLQVTGFDADGNQTIIDMPVNIAQGPPTPEINREAGIIPQLPVGQTLATSGGVPVPVSVIPFLAEKTVAVEGDGWTFNVNLGNGAGEVGGTPEEPLIQFTQSGTGSVEGGGFMPETTASVWFFSDPTMLGTVAVADDGSFAIEFMVDAKFIPSGEHTLQVQGVGEDGFIKAANLGVIVSEPQATTTSEGASTLLWWGLGALLILAIIVAVVLVASRRRSA